MSREHIASVLKYLREKKGLTADQVGALIGKSGKTVNAWENNRGQPDAEMLICLCDIYEVDDILNEFRDVPKEKNPPLSAEEKMILDSYRKFNDIGKRHIIEQIIAMSESGRYFDEPEVFDYVARSRTGKVELVKDMTSTEDAPDII